MYSNETALSLSSALVGDHLKSFTPHKEGRRGGTKAPGRHTVRAKGGFRNSQGRLGWLGQRESMMLTLCHSCDPRMK